MLASQIPTKMPLIWGVDAGGSFIRTVPNPSQIPIQAGAASFTDGFPPLCFTPVGSGGTPPFGQDFNGIMNAMTAWLQWVQAGGWAITQYDASFADSGTYNIGGYPKGAVIASAATLGQWWMSTVDNNMTDPDTGGANWVSITFGASGARIITANTTQTLNANDSYVGFNRSSPANQNVTLPTYPTGASGVVTIQDLNKNFSAGPLTILPPTGTISGDANYVMNIDKQSATFVFYPTAVGGPLWGILS